MTLLPESGSQTLEHLQKTIRDHFKWVRVCLSVSVVSAKQGMHLVHTGSQIDRQIDRQVDSQIDSQIDRQIDRQTDENKAKKACEIWRTTDNTCYTIMVPLPFPKSAKSLKEVQSTTCQIIFDT